MTERMDKDRFFTMAETYDKMCTFLVPHYEEMQNEIFNIIDKNKNEIIKVIDLGAGSGILLEKFLENFPNSQCIWIDFSDDFMKVAKNRLNRFDNRVNYVLCNIDENWEDKTGSKADVIVSMSAIHHLENNTKREIYKKCFNVLNDNGWFFNIDEMKTRFEDAYLDELNFWYKFVQSKKDEFTGQMKDYYDKWIIHFENWKIRNIDNKDKQKVKGDDIHENYITQLEWLKEAGFERVNLFYKYHLWNLIGGKKLNNNFLN